MIAWTTFQTATVLPRRPELSAEVRPNALKLRPAAPILHIRFAISRTSLLPPRQSWPDPFCSGCSLNEPNASIKAQRRQNILPAFRPKPYLRLKTREIETALQQTKTRNVRAASLLTSTNAARLIAAGKPGPLIRISRQMAHVGRMNRTVQYGELRPCKTAVIDA